MKHSLKAACAAIALVCANMASAQTYPIKPIRIVTSEVGGGNDFSARLLGLGLSEALGQQTVIENRPGGEGLISAMTVATANADGYTLLVQASGLWILPFLKKSLPYDPLRDFAPVTLIQSSPNIVVIPPSLPVSTVPELITHIKSKNGEFNYASCAAGCSPHLAAELFKAMTGVVMSRVPYKGSTTALIDMIGGRIPLMFPAAGSVAPHIKSGKLKAIAVTTAQPSILFPGLPAVAATIPGYESASHVALFAPAKTPPAVINRLHQVLAVYLQRPEVKEKFFNGGVESIGNTPTQFGTMVKSEMAKWGKLIKDSGIRED